MVMDFLKFMAGPEAQGLGEKASSFTDEVLLLLREIRDNTAATRKLLEGERDGK